MPAAPEIRHRSVQPYLAIHCSITDGVPAAVDAAFPELMQWVGSRAIALTGAPFMRFLRIDAAGEPLELEVAVPVADGQRGDGRVQARTLPAGRYVVYRHIGPYRSETAPDLAVARTHVLDWMRAHDVRYDCAVEHYCVGPYEEPDFRKWETEFAYRVIDA